MIRPDEHSPGPGPTQAGGDRWEGLVRTITLAAAPELARRRHRQNFLGQVEAWSRPLWSAAALLILIFGSTLILALRAPQDPSLSTPLIVEAVLPNPLSLWMETGTQPTLMEVVLAFEEDRP